MVAMLLLRFSRALKSGIFAGDGVQVVTQSRSGGSGFVVVGHDGDGGSQIIEAQRGLIIPPAHSHHVYYNFWTLQNHDQLSLWRASPNFLGF